MYLYRGSFEEGCAKALVGRFIEGVDMQILLLLLFLQIVLESLPVSSSGHIFIIKKFLPDVLSGFSEKTLEVLDHFAHGPTLVIIMILFWRDWTYPVKGLFKKRKCFTIFCKIVGLGAIVEIITVVFYAILKVWLGQSWLFSSEFVLWVGLLMTAVGLLSLRWLPTNGRYASWDAPRAVALGVAQGVALLPGISRFGATYVVARWLKISPRRSFQISFLIHVPVILGGLLCVGETLFLKKLLFSWQGGIVLVVATVCGYFALRFARRWAHQNKFWRFGLYVFALFIAMALLFLVHYVG